MDSYDLRVVGFCLCVIASRCCVGVLICVLLLVFLGFDVMMCCGLFTLVWIYLFVCFWLHVLRWVWGEFVVLCFWCLRSIRLLL